MEKIPMLDLKLEYQYMKADIDAAIQRCLQHQRWILGPEVFELEDKHSCISWRKTLHWVFFWN